ncbi:unnamed protein product [Soboliphyme baturini]|uniref:DNA replication ATP-dependent helicase/nuclease n=1 Tax=Soboliphyme baturini TaxID=241478 RepID=A0A183JAA4_9BILA|nr:unnamed protein product [Soboliphyme baturini]
MSISLFEKLELAHQECVVSLTQQYRMNREIGSLSSALFYGSQLRCANEMLESLTLELQQPVDENIPGWIKKCLSTAVSDAVVFLDTSYSEDMRCENFGSGCLRNDGEATLLCQICEHFLKVSDGNKKFIVRYQVDIFLILLIKNTLQINWLTNSSTTITNRATHKDVKGSVLTRLLDNVLMSYKIIKNFNVHIFVNIEESHLRYLEESYTIILIQPRWMIIFWDCDIFFQMDAVAHFPFISLIRCSDFCTFSIAFRVIALYG